MKESFHYVLMASQALLQKKLLAGLKDTGLTAGQPKVLDFLGEHNGANQKEIARGCHIEAGSLTSVLNRMEEAGLVERRMLNGNRRTYHIFLTEKGHRLSETVRKIFGEIEEELFSDIPVGEREQFLSVFLCVYHKLASWEEGKTWKN